MRAFLFDADAFLCVRSLSLLQLFRDAQSSTIHIFMTEYVARHELSTVGRIIDELANEGLLTVQPVPVRGSPASEHLRQLRKEKTDKKGRRLHKGEIESIAWAMSLARPNRPRFISNDKGARDGAELRGVPTGDLMDCIVEAVEAGALAYEDAKQKVSVWADKRQELCRPRDYDGFDETFQRRRIARDRTE